MFSIHIPAARAHRARRSVSPSRNVRGARHPWQWLLAALAVLAASSDVARAQRSPAAVSTSTLRATLKGTPIGLEPPREVSSALDSIVALAIERSPRLRASRARVDAARASIDPAASRPDPMLMAGVQNLPIAEPGFGDFMTMKMIGLSQTLPYPGKLFLARTAAERALDGADAELKAVELDIVYDTKTAYYEIAYLDVAYGIVEKHRESLLSTLEATEASYAVGRGGQQDVLRARVEIARLGEQATTLREERQSALARLNAVLDLPSDTPLGAAAFPSVIVRAAVADSASRVRFVSPTLGARAADSPLPTVAALQQIAIQNSPLLRAHQARIAQRAARVELAGKSHLPDLDVSIAYGHRSGFGDMISATVAVPIPLQKGRKQNALVAAERAELAAEHAEHDEMVNQLRARVAATVTHLERARTQLALYKRAVLPQAHATLEAILVGYRVDRAEYLALLEAQTTLFNYETAYYRTLAEFATSAAELDRLTGTEVIR